MREVGTASHPGRIVAECRGDSGAVYMLGYDPGKKEWRCTCPAKTRACSHILALMSVTVAIS